MQRNAHLCIYRKVCIFIYYDKYRILKYAEGIKSISSTAI